MSALPVETERPSAESGDLTKTPLFATLRRIQRARLTGRLWLSRHGQERWLSFEGGELRAARSSEKEHWIGRSLVVWGYLSQEDLERALAAQRTSGRRLDQILVEQGLLAHSVLDREARRLMEQIASSALSWRDGSFRFDFGVDSGDEDIAFSLSVTEMIIEGIRRIPESEKFLELLGNLSRVPTPVAATAGADAARLPVEATLLLSRMDGKSDVRQLLVRAPSSRLEAAKVLYTLVYCGFVELRPAAAKSADTAAIKTPAAAQEPAHQHRSLVRSTYRRIDWLSHYDLLGVPITATSSEIAAAHERLRMLFDPALRGRPDLADCGRELTVLSHRLREVYETLSNPEARQAYDRTIQKAQAVLSEESRETEPDRAPSNRASEKVRRITASQSYQRALELIEANDVYPAIQMLEGAVDFAPDNAKYRHLLGKAQMKNRWWRQQGVEQLEQAARLAPKSAEIQASLTEAYLEQGDYQKALACARTALNVAPRERKEPYRRLELRVEEVARNDDSGKKSSPRQLRSIA
jgi:tetratricopeptide (TPR) repeat protein